MMRYARTIHTVRETLCEVFARTDAWFDKADEVRRYRPTSGRWSVDQVLEHVVLTNRYLLLTLRKWSAIAEHRATRGDSMPNGESDFDRLVVIGERGSFGWERPEHMEPTAVPNMAAVRVTLRQQLGECLILLERLKDGVGALAKVTMTVNDLGKIDLYQWLYFLAQHVRRHLQQMESIEAECIAGSANVGSSASGS